MPKKQKRSAARPKRDVIEPKGTYHNLAEILDFIRHHYFDGKYKEVVITWVDQVKHRSSDPFSTRLAGYGVEGSIIYVNRGLDASWVPRYFLEYLVYHELLHRKHLPVKKDGRYVFHTRRFRIALETFASYDKADSWKKLNGARLLLL